MNDELPMVDGGGSIYSVVGAGASRSSERKDALLEELVAFGPRLPERGMLSG
jgi:hypothetical protein